MSSEEYVTQGNTALYDAIGLAINQTGATKGIEYTDAEREAIEKTLKNK